MVNLTLPAFMLKAGGKGIDQGLMLEKKTILMLLLKMQQRA
jgi:hypothetical protein